MAEKRYNLRLVEMGSEGCALEPIVHEIELLHTTADDGEVYIDNLIHTTFVELEEAIKEHQQNA